MAAKAEKRGLFLFRIALLRQKNFTPLTLVHANVNVMGFEIPIPYINKAVFLRIELAHSCSSFSTEILPTCLQLDLLFPRHTISLDETLQSNVKHTSKTKGHLPICFRLLPMVTPEAPSWGVIALNQSLGKWNTRI